MAPTPRHEHSHDPSHDHGHDGDHDHSSHGHAHGHSHAGDVPGLPHVPHASYGKLLICFWIIAVFMVVEIVGGWMFGSLALMSDGFHMLSDALSLGLAALAVRLGARRATAERTFGYKRLEILAAFGNGLTLLVLSVFILVQGVERLLNPRPVDARSLLWVASLGLLVNLFVAWWLHRGEGEKTVNEEGALWHVIGDLGASLAAVAAGVAILLKGWLWVDPALSLLIAALIAYGGVRVMRRSGHILIEGTPAGVSLEALRQAMVKRPQVRGVHDLHVWTLNGRDLYLSAHVDVATGALSEKQVMADLQQALIRDHKVDHMTLQSHCPDADCGADCEPGLRSLSI
jgi:cobalt-zinc-cadmium efflux system protein